jgi:2-hydroxy-6-oxonona-2,4-dienedioate hydrolase
MRFRRHTPASPPAERRWSIVAGRPMHAMVWPRAAGAPVGRAAVLVHGLCSSRYMARLGPRMTEMGDVYAPDLPGFGASLAPPDGNGLADLAAALGEFMDRAGLSWTVVVANSTGCQVAAELLVRRPALAAHLVMVGPTFDAGARGLRRQIPRWLWEAAVQPAWQKWALTLDYFDAGPRRILAVMREGQRQRLEDRVTGLPMPTLVMRGSRDSIAGGDWIELLVERLPRGEAWTAEGATHAVNASDPALLARRVQAFVAARPHSAADRVVRTSTKRGRTEQ